MIPIIINKPCKAKIIPVNFQYHFFDASTNFIPTGINNIEISQSKKGKFILLFLLAQFREILMKIRYRLDAFVIIGDVVFLVRRVNIIVIQPEA